MEDVMLNRNFLISRLVKAREGDSQEELFALRRELRGLSLPKLAERYLNKLEDDPYAPSVEDPPQLGGEGVPGWAEAMYRMTLA